MSKVNWTLVVIVGVLALLALMVGGSLLGAPGYRGWGYGGWGMMGPWMMGGMFFMWLIPLGVVVLAVLGVAWLVRAMGGAINPPAAAHNCPSCGRPVRADWHHCANCGNKLTT